MKMSTFDEVQKKGVDRCWLETSLDPEQLHLHITEIPAGTRAHPPHTHSGAEAFYILEGSGEIETVSGTIPLAANQVVILDASHLHGLVNTGSVPMKYIVIIAKS
jgi:mannose-6-phosphate isomerase-like protein (cupin superfamily)